MGAVLVMVVMVAAGIIRVDIVVKNTELTSKSGSPLDRIFRYLYAYAVWLIRGTAN